MELTGVACATRGTRALLQRAGRRFARYLEDGPVHVEQPPVIAAADAVLRHEPEFERGAAMAATPVEQPDVAAAVAEKDQLFVQNFYPLGKIIDLGRELDRLPETTQVLAARRTGPDVGQFGIRSAGNT